jgi:DNA-binding CsgD family transcriptional regulator
MRSKRALDPGPDVSSLHEDDVRVRLLADSVREYARVIQAASHELISALAVLNPIGVTTAKRNEMTSPISVKNSERRRLGILTLRQRDTLKLLAEGKNAKEAAALLGISPKTAYVHRSQVMRKLDLRSQSDLIYFAIRAGLSSTARGRQKSK